MSILNCYGCGGILSVQRYTAANDVSCECLPPARFQSAAAPPANESAHRCGSEFPEMETAGKMPMISPRCEALASVLYGQTGVHCWTDKKRRTSRCASCEIPQDHENRVHRMGDLSESSFYFLA